jgi:hypothetical protein
MKWLKSIIVALYLGGMASAQMAETLKSEFHKQEELGAVIIGRDEASTLPSVIADPNVRILSLQLFKGEFDESKVPSLMQWVQAGHSLWFYDARLGPLFGFAPVMMKKNQFTNKEEEGVFGGRKMKGLATTLMAMGGHVADTGVGQVSAFLPTTETEEYGAVNVTADTVPLLRFTYNSPAVAALRREGRGLIVFKPLLWPEALSGDRFQSNLLEYSAGYQVPGPAGVGKVGTPPGPNAEFIKGNPALPMPVGPEVSTVKEPTDPSREPVVARPINPENADEVEVIGEGVLVGQVVNEKLRFETGTSSIQLSRAEVESIELNKGGKLDVVHWRDGHQSTGFLMDKSVEIDVNGDTKKVDKKMLLRIRWGKAF